MTTFEIKDMIDTLIYRLYNLNSRLVYCLNYKKVNSTLKANIELRDKHAGKRCFIIGTGPSLSKVDLTKLENEITFGVNFFYKSPKYMEHHPTYYMLSDEFFFNQGVDYIDEIFHEINDSSIIFNYKGKSVVDQCKNKPKSIFYIYQKLFPHKNLTIVDADKNMTIGLNVVTGCIQMAIYMGFNEIVLLGSDYNSFALAKSQHCYSEEEERTISLAEELKFFAHATQFHYYIEELAKKRGVTILNATPNSLLDAYKKTDFEDIEFFNGKS